MGETVGSILRARSVYPEKQRCGVPVFGGGECGRTAFSVSDLTEPPTPVCTAHLHENTAPLLVTKDGGR